MIRFLLPLMLPILLWGQDNTSLKVAHGARFTSFTMSTQNGLFGPYPELQDFYAQSFGLEYLGRATKGAWSLNLDIYATYLAAGNPFEKDSLTAKSSRYESGLVAVDAPERRALSMPSIAELVYHKNKLRVGLGNFALESTFLNMEHGRMIPSTYSGVNAGYRWTNFKAEVAWIAMVGARSTSSFKSVAKSLAQYNPGLDTAGSRHDKTDVEAPYGLFFGAGEHTHALGKWYGTFKSEVFLVPNVFGSVAFNEIIAHNEHLWQLQYIRQFQLGNGGNADPLLAYFQQERSNYFGIKYSHKVGGIDYYAASSYIDGAGKLMFPREWGREDLVTFQSRERQEGMGKTLAIVAGAKGKWAVNNVQHSGGVSTGIYMRPDPTDYKFNKYGMPSNQQTNLWWAQSWKGGQHKLLNLLVLKVPLSSTPLTAGQTINKVDMVNLNIVYRYTFMPL